MADHGDLNPTDEPEGAITDEAESGCTKMMVGSPQQVPSDFHSSQRSPSSSITSGSIEPPNPSAQTNGSSESSTNGPAGESLTATEMH